MSYWHHSHVIVVAAGQFFASDKNHIGVVWFKLPNLTPGIAILHDGSEVQRPSTWLYDKCFTKANTTLGAIKIWTRT